MKSTSLTSAERYDNSLILIVEAVSGLREGMERLLVKDGYRLLIASDEHSAAQAARLSPPDLILICLGEPPRDFIMAANRIREPAGLTDDVPVVTFCIKAVAEGEELAYGHNVYAISPDNFNQLRSFLKKLLNGFPSP